MGVRRRAFNQIVARTAGEVMAYFLHGQPQGCLSIWSPILLVAGCSKGRGSDANVEIREPPFRQCLPRSRIVLGCDSYSDIRLVAEGDDLSRVGT